jgi:hypothetical protein
MLQRRSLTLLRLVIVSCALVVTSASAGQSAPANAVDQITGRWELRGRWTSDAISTIIELIGGGWYSQTLVASVRLHYDYNGSDLVLVALDKKGEPDNRSRVVMQARFDGDTLTLASATDTIKMLRSAGGEFAGDIKGRWLLLSGDKEHAVTQEFSGDGNLRVITALSGEVGRFRLINEKEIEWSPMLPTRPTRRTNFKVENEKLVLWAGSLRDELIRLR